MFFVPDEFLFNMYSGSVDTHIKAPYAFISRFKHICEAEASKSFIVGILVSPDTIAVLLYCKKIT